MKKKLSWFEAYAAARMSGLTGRESGKVADEYTSGANQAKPKPKRKAPRKRA